MKLEKIIAFICAFLLIITIIIDPLNFHQDVIHNDNILSNNSMFEEKCYDGVVYIKHNYKTTSGSFLSVKFNKITKEIELCDVNKELDKIYQNNS